MNLYYVTPKGQLARFNRFLKEELIYNGVGETNLYPSALNFQQKEEIIIFTEQIFEISNQPIAIRIDLI